MTTTASRTVARPGLSSGRPTLHPLALLAGGVLVATALALHPRGTVTELEFVERIAAEPQPWLAGHLAMAVGGLLLAAGLGPVRRLATGRGRRVTAVGVAMAIVGAVGSALGDFSHGALAYVLIDHVDAETSLAIQTDFFETPALAVLPMLGMLLPLGVLVLAVGLALSRALPLPAALLLVASPLLIQLGYLLTELPMPLMVLPFVAGVAFVARAVHRLPHTTTSSSAG